MSKGYYSTLNHIIRQMKQDGKIIIDIDQIADSISVKNLKRKELEEKCKKAMASVSLYQNGFRSVLHGKGIFVDYAKAKNKVVVEQLIRNVEKDERQKSYMMDVLQTIVEGIPETTEKQIRFCFDEDGQLAVDDNGCVLLAEEMSKQELLELLYKLV